MLIRSRTPRWWRRDLWPALTALAGVTLMLAGCRVEGRPWWCACGHFRLWPGDIWSPHCSQHLFDPYSLTHVLHGVAFYGLLAWAARRLAVPWRFCIAVLLECGWEVFENSQFVIERYRQLTHAIGYQGDSIVNSLGDVVCCALGFYIARRLPIWGSIALFLAVEIVLLVWIRDCLLLNILMLLYPLDAIRTWQLGSR